jgi:hypothetical protein
MYARSNWPYLDESVVDNAFDIAWHFIKSTHDVADDSAAKACIATEIMRLLERGERHRIVLANRAIAACEKARRGFAPD